MVVICLSDVAERFHGFLRSIMLNPHPGVYVAMDLDAGACERVWQILGRWWQAEPRGMGVLIIRNKEKVGKVELKSFGAPKREIVEYDGIYGVKRKAPAVNELKAE